MADGINIEGGFEDVDLTSDFLDGSIEGVLLNFASELQRDLIESAKKHDLQTAANTLIRTLEVAPKVIEADGMLIYTLDMVNYAKFLDQGVSGTERKFNSPFSYKENSKLPIKAMMDYGRLKDALGLGSEKEVKRFGFAAARNKKLFGQKPTHFFSDVVKDGRIEKLEEEIGKKLAFVLIERL